ncbi:MULTISPECIES: iron chelate uptake ABC transporter family permease subunit [Streptomyces]|uniref:FecCD family ABC transporter permease n=1 Tax=Streptomyces TaxID=1883 RepID=UPI001040D12A|nr:MULTISPECIES: iron ABC transporter permease [Streptomyces]MBT3077960.1 iron ABC transporter permease [Streptomyces sp. COG21]MBT3084804.1 iron ABC transporter permease [Streptomyces sp. COG20]MBT3087701.1 iron ABC transporter permease [Streptomyces sp. CYG21]MBT3098794.1 iron ABC transporter permease [Streptomyces sp. CBG30]MBT3103248.1 iron ABC transporter permease [Streptomyces sp. COG19]
MDLLIRVAAPDSALREATLARLLADRRARTRRTVLAVSVLTAVLLGLLVASVLLGGVGRVDPADVLPAAFGLRTGLADYMIFRIRVPRALAALLSGALFGLAGALYQRLIRNPLATPDIVGISAGAGAGATTVLLLAPALPLGTPLAAVTGSLVLLGLVYALSRRGGLNTYRLVLVGIGLSGVCTAYTNYLFSLADQHSIAVAMRWLIGSVNGADWTGVSTLAIGLAVCGVCAARLGRPLGSMSLGDELATGLGTSVPAARVAVLALGAGAAALATSVVGPIGFVSLISGPIAARLVGADRAFGLAPFVGAALVLGADVLAQNAPLISPVPTGVLTALLGAPYFVWLILRRRPGATS